MPETKFAPHGALLSEGFPQTGAKVGVIMGSDSDYGPCMKACCEMLHALAVPFEYGVVSAHRTHGRMDEYVGRAEARGLQLIIACAGGSAHLQGMSASKTTLPVLAVTPQSSFQDGLDGVYSCIRMPKGVPLAFLGIGEAGAANAALMAVRFLARHDAELHDRIVTFIDEQTKRVPYAPHN